MPEPLPGYRCSRAEKRWAGSRRRRSAGITPAGCRSPIARRSLTSSRMPEPLRRVALYVAALMLATAVPASAQLDSILKELDTLTRSGAATPGDAKIGAALKQALQVGTESAVKLTGKTDGYFGTRPSRS